VDFEINFCSGLYKFLILFKQIVSTRLWQRQLQGVSQLLDFRMWKSRPLEVVFSNYRSMIGCVLLKTGAKIHCVARSCLCVEATASLDLTCHAKTVPGYPQSSFSLPPPLPPPCLNCSGYTHTVPSSTLRWWLAILQRAMCLQQMERKSRWSLREFSYLMESQHKSASSANKWVCSYCKYCFVLLKLQSVDRHRNPW